MSFIHDLEEAADLCQLEVRAFNRNDAIRIADLAGLKDRNLAEKALAEGYDLHRSIQTGSTRDIKGHSGWPAGQEQGAQQHQ